MKFIRLSQTIVSEVLIANITCSCLNVYFWIRRKYSGERMVSSLLWEDLQQVLLQEWHPLSWVIRGPLLSWFHWVVVFLYFIVDIYNTADISFILYILLISFINVSNYPSKYLMFYYIIVDNLPIRCSKIAISCWTGLPYHVRGMIELI